MKGPAAGRKPFVWRAWTDQDLAILRELAGKVPTAEIAGRLGRSVLAVQTEARLLGISLRSPRPAQGAGVGGPQGPESGTRRRYWSLEEDALLRTLAGREPAAEIARRIGRSRNAVATYAHTLGLSLRVEDRTWDAEIGRDER